MTAVTTLTGALSTGPGTWHTIDWYAVHRTVQRLQARIVKAVQAGRWNKVRALQHLLTHSCSGKALAVRRVTENDGKKTPGVDGILWDTPAKKTRAMEELRQRGYRAQPLRRIYIPKTSSTHRWRPCRFPRCMTEPCRPSICSRLIPSRRRGAIRTPTGSVRSVHRRMPWSNASMR